MKDTSKRGAASTLLVSAKFLELGLNVLNPLCDSSKYDLVLEHDRVFYRLQIKTAYSDRGSDKFIIPFKSVVSSKSGNKIHKYSSSDVDFIIGVLKENSSFYCFPIQNILNRDSIKVALSGKTISKNIDSELYKNNITLGTVNFRF